MRRTATEGRREQRGNVLVFVTLALIALFGFAAWSTETGQAWTARSQLQAASDSAALAGAGELIVPGQPSDPAAAVAAAKAFGLENKSIGVPTDILAGDIETGRWDVQTRTFTPLPGSTDRTQVRSVRLLGRRDDTANGPIPTVLGRIMGVDSIAVATEAVGYVGFAGLMPPGTALLPVAIDCCEIAGPACDNDYCQTIAANPPNPCTMPVGSGDFEGQTVSCLEFFSKSDQNACWTELSSTGSSVSASGLRNIVSNANPTPVGGDPIYLDNGIKTPVLKEIQERFKGQGGYSGNPAGEDTNGNGTIDSWLVPFPIVECQSPGSHCSGGAPQKIVGVACFDLKWASVGPDKRIYGNFVCPNDPRFSDSACGVGFGPGGDVPTIDARYPVLVD